MCDRPYPDAVLRSTTHNDLLAEFTANPEAAIERLNDDQPVALLPVRLETKFEDGQLLVRVYPDEIHVDTHEVGLTIDEREWGRQFWKRVRVAADPDASLNALELLPNDPLTNDPKGRHDVLLERVWNVFAERYGPRRAAWVKTVTAPEEADRMLDGPFESDESIPKLTFPESIARRPASTTRPALACLLPDRWLVLGYNDGSVVNTAWSNPVKERLAVGPTPDLLAVQPQDADEPDGVVHNEMQWLVDFESAEKAGMAMRMDLDDEGEEEETSKGFDRLVVLGVRASADAESSADRLHDLFTAHHYTDGLSFVQAGTPTNNAPDKSAGTAPGSSAGEADAIRKFETAPPAVESWDLSDGDVVARALAIDPAKNDSNHVFGRVQGANRQGWLDARHVNSVVWPATWQYYVFELLTPFDWTRVADDMPDVHEDVLRWLSGYRRHFTRYVAADGPLPMLRVADQPYGLLPVTPLNSWKPLELDSDPWLLPETTLWDDDPLFTPEPYDVPDVAEHLVERLQALRPIFDNSTSAVPQIGARSDPAEELIEIIGMEATAASFRTRDLLGKWGLLGNLEDPGFGGGGLIDHPIGDFDHVTLNELREWLLALFEFQADRHLGLDELLPESPRFANISYARRTKGPIEPVVGDEPGATTKDAASTDYTVLREEFPGRTDSLFDLLVYYATLRSFVGARRRLGARYRGGQVPVEPELYWIDPEMDQETVWNRLRDKIPESLADHPELSPGNTYGEAITASRSFPTGKHPEIDDDFARHHESLRYLASRNPDHETTQRLLSGTLDLASHRLDAWITSLATQRLDRLRADQSHAAESEPGLHVGAYGWVEDLRPRQRQRSMGYIHAPSLPQATSAAVLRDGHLSHTNDSHRETLSVDLTAKRVRLATDLLDAVRQGTPLGAALGYRFERGLHQHTADLDAYVPTFRRLAPQVANRFDHGNDGPGDEPPEAVAASTVVDGLTLYRMWEANKLDFDSEDLPTTNPEREAVEELLVELGDAIDAVADLLTAESVHQQTTANPERAAASLDSLAVGDSIPEPEFPRTPRTGTGVMHRLAVLFDASTVPESPWLSDDESRRERQLTLQVRAQAAPHLDDWVGHLLGAPERVHGRGEYFADDQLADEAVLAEQIVSLADLDVSPLDLVYLTEGDERAKESELETRFAYYLLRNRPEGVPPDATVQLSFGRFDDIDPNALSVGEFLEVVRSVRDLVTGGRAIDARDLALPEEAIESGVLEALLEDRADDATAALRDVATDLTALRTAFRDEDEIAADGPEMVSTEPGTIVTNHLEEAVVVIEMLQTFPLDTLATIRDGFASIDVSALRTELSILHERLSVFDATTAVETLRTALAEVETNQIQALFALQSNVIALRDTTDLRKALALLNFDSAILREALTVAEANTDTLDIAPVGTLLNALDKSPDINGFQDLEELPDLDYLFQTANTAIETIAELDQLPTVFELDDADSNATLEEVGLCVHGAVEEIDRLTGRMEFGDLAATLAVIDRSVRTGRKQLPAEPITVVSNFRVALLNALRDCLFRSSFFDVHGSVPKSMAGSDDVAETAVLEQAQAVESIVAERIEVLDTINGSGVKQSRERLSITLGEAFQSLAPFEPSDPGELANAFDPDHQTDLLNGDPQAIETWLNRTACVRNQTDTLVEAYTRSEANRGRPLRNLSVGQLPFEDDDSWVGLPEIEPGQRRLSLVAQFHGADLSGSAGPSSDPFRTLSGLFVDEWTEIVPGNTETTGLTFHFDAPENRAPQAVLLTIPPDDGGWTVETLVETVTEALNLSKLRMVEPDTLGELGGILPALCFPENSRGPGGPETIAVNFDGLGDDGS